MLRILLIRLTLYLQRKRTLEHLRSYDSRLLIDAGLPPDDLEDHVRQCYAALERERVCSAQGGGKTLQDRAGIAKALAPTNF